MTEPEPLYRAIRILISDYFAPRSLNRQQLHFLSSFALFVSLFCPINYFTLRRFQGPAVCALLAENAVFPLHIAGAGIAAARVTAVEELGVTLPLTTNERDSGDGAGEENDVSCLMKALLREKMTQSCFQWRSIITLHELSNKRSAGLENWHPCLYPSSLSRFLSKYKMREHVQIGKKS